jgi:HK97 gp10 family phage protein
MSFAVRTRLEGLAELKANLAALGDEVATKVGNKANREAAKVVAGVIKSVAPRGTGSTVRRRRLKSGAVTIADYGRLVDNIKVRKARARSENTITFNISTGKAFWGLFQEFGTVNMPARPWMRPAFDAAADVGLKIQIAELERGIERAAKKLRKFGPVLPNGRNA